MNTSSTTTTERIVNRFPRFYKIHDSDSILFQLCDKFAHQLNEARNDLFKIMRSHWIESATGSELDLIGSIFNLIRGSEEKDEQFRFRIITLIQFCIATSLFPGGGTQKAIKGQLKLYLNPADGKDYFETNDIKFIENPPYSQELQLEKSFNDKWDMDSNSIFDENFSIMLSLDDNNHEVKNPTIILDSDSFIKFSGTVKSGEQLVFTEQGNAYLDDLDVTEFIESRGKIKINKKKSQWMYQEDVSPKIGKFDEALFDQNFFHTHIPKVKLKINWIAHLRATFEISLSSSILEESGLSIKFLEEIIDRIKAEGVRAIIKVEERKENKIKDNEIEEIQRENINGV